MIMVRQEEEEKEGEEEEEESIYDIYACSASAATAAVFSFGNGRKGGGGGGEDARNWYTNGHFVTDSQNNVVRWTQESHFLIGAEICLHYLPYRLPTQY